MRYNLESTLPIHAFQPLGGRHNPFKHRMTLEGGGGGVISSIGNAIGSAVEGVGSALASVDDFVGDTIPGGWSTIAAVAVPYAAPMFTGAALTAGQAAALAAGTSATTSAIRGDDIEDILKNAAISGAASYGLNSLSNMGGDSLALPSETPYVDMPDGLYELGSSSIPTPSYDSIQLPSETPYVDLPDGETLLTPDSAYAPNVNPDLNLDASNIPAELSLDALYQDLPDGINQLSYDPANPEIIAATNTPQIGKDEEAFERLIKQAQEAPDRKSVV